MQRLPTCKNCHLNYEFKDNKPIGPRIPLMLPCGHTFCEGCLLKAARKHPEIKCFECQEIHTLDVNGEIGVKHFVPDIYTLGLIAYNQRLALESTQSYLCSGPLSCFNGLGDLAKKLNSFLSNDYLKNENASTENLVLCDECLTKNATCQCNTCENCKFCDNCFKQIHQGSKTLSRHQSLPINLESDKELSCAIHQGRKLEFYDQQLKQAVCALCAISETCQGHQMMPITEMLDGNKKDLFTKYEQVQETLFWLQQSKEVLRSSVPVQVDEASKVLCNIHSTFNVAHSLLQKRQMELLEEAAEILDSSSCTNELMEYISKKISLINATIKEYDMVKKDQRIMNLKTSKFIKGMSEFIDIPCIIQMKKNDFSNSCHFNDDLINECVFLKSIEKEKFKLKKINELPNESLEKLKSFSSDSLITANDFLSNFDSDVLDIKRPADELVTVTFVENPFNFTVQLNADKERISTMMAALNKCCHIANSQTDLLYKVEKGQLCCAQCSADNIWYRARVVSCHSKDNPDLIPTWNNDLSIQVHYIDFGSYDWLPVNRLRQIKSEFFEVPEMGLSCSLTDIIPPFQADSWSSRSIKAFKSLVGHKTFMMNTLKCRSNKHFVDLQTLNTAESTLDNDHPVSIRDTLVFIEVASYSSLFKLKPDFYQCVRKYKPAVSLEINKFVGVYVTNIESLDNLCIQRLDSPVLELRDKLSKLYRDQNNSKIWRIEWPHKNMVCAAKFSMDEFWYRALVKNVNNNDTVDVEYVDYGNSETLPIISIRKIPDMHLSLPRQALNVKLWNVDTEGKKWAPEVKENLEKYLFNKQLVAVARDITNDVLSIELFDTSTEKDVNINDLLINGEIFPTGKRLGSSPKIIQPVKSYKPPVLPTTNKFFASCMYIDMHGVFYFHPLVKDDNDALLQLMKELNSNQFQFESCPSTALLYNNQACVARFLEDNGIYRAKVLQVVDDCNVKVEYVDFGNSEVVDKNQICLKSWRDEIPIQCLAIHLADVKPINDTNWSPDALMFLSSKILNETVEIVIQGSKDSSPISALIRFQNDYISHLLITKGYAKKIVSSDCPLNKEKKNLLQNVLVETKNVSNTEPMLQYKKSILPNVGRPFDVVVTQIDCPNLVYIQRLPPCADSPLLVDDSEDPSAQDAYNQIQELQLISDLINQEGYFDSHSFTKTPQIGMPCIARYTKDGLYYRAQIDGLHIETKKAEIRFVDYGTYETLPIACLKPITRELLRLPVQSTLVKICGMKEPSKNVSTVNPWDERVTNQFYELVADKRLIAQFIGVDQEGYQKIHLYDRCFVEASETGQTKDCLVGELMHKYNLVDFELDEDEKAFTKML